MVCCCVLGFIVVTLQCCSQSRLKPIGSIDNPIKLYFTPSIDADEISSVSERFIKLLEKESGYFFKSAIPTSYMVIVEAFGTQRCDVALMNSFGYLLANQKYGAEARLRILRNGEGFYRGEIIAHEDSGIKKLKDIQGKKFAFTDPSSTSGYLLPLKLFKENDIGLGQHVFAMKHDNVAVMVYQKKVDAGACFYSPPDKSGKIKDARSRIITQFPDVEERVKIIAVTDAIPNDPFVFRKDLPEEVKQKVSESIMRVISTEEGKRSFYEIYSADGVVQADDKDYDSLRELLRFTGKNSEELMGEK